MDNIEQSLECTAVIMLQAMLDTLFIKRKNRTLLRLSIISQVTTTSLLLLHFVPFILFGFPFRESSYVFIEKTYQTLFYESFSCLRYYSKIFSLTMAKVTVSR